MKNSYLPHAMLAALLVAALLTLLAGVKMAREEEVVRTEVGREEIGDLSAGVMTQLARLDDLYEDHLRRLASMDLSDRFALRNACDQIVGVRQIAVAVDVDGGGNAGRAFQETLESGWRGVPILPGQAEPALGGDLIELSPGDLALSRESGWLQRPGQPLMYWQRRTPGVYVVITPNPEQVRAAVHGWLGEWVREIREPVDATGANFVVTGSRGIVSGFGATESHYYGAADVVVPMRSRFGGWKVSAWDEREAAVIYDFSMLWVSVGVAGFFAMLGLGGFIVLRRALRLSEQRVSFVNRVSHELRTPLTNILLNNDLAVDAVELGDDLAAAGRLGLIREEAGRLSRLIANVLTFSRSGDDSVTVANEVYSLVDLVERTLAPFRASLRRKGIAVKVDVDPELRALGEMDSAGQVLANLISNVEKYAAGGGVLEIEGGQVEGRRDAPATFLRVSDAGPGIPEAAAERVFEPFVRLSERVDEGVSGTGLGLAIARELAVKMGGQLTLEESDRGAVFVFEMRHPPENIVTMEGEKIS